MGNDPAFTDTLRMAVAHARESIVTIGMRPSTAHTGFGYIRTTNPVSATGNRVFQVAEFVEKPDRATAERYVASGQYYWNCGMFFLTAERLRAEAKQFLPKLADFMEKAIHARNEDLEAVITHEYPHVENISIDYGIMEKMTGPRRMVAGDFEWNDVGSWAALSAIRPADDQRGNVTVGDALTFDTSNCTVVSEPGGPMITALGVDNLVIVATHDAVLVMPKDRAQEVKNIVEALKASGRDNLL